jgi:hypothetical protein
MAKFTIRIALSDATDEEYANLSALLATQGISDPVLANNGIRYLLPREEFYLERASSAANVRDSLASLLADFGKPYSTLITEGSTRAFQNLQTRPAISKPQPV